MVPNDMVDRAWLGDLVHPTAKGYEIWAEAMEPMLKKLLDEKPQASSSP